MPGQRCTASCPGGSPAAELLITGEAGIGKSRLVEVAAADAGELGVTAAWGWCLPLSEGLPLLPIVDALTTLNDERGGQLLRTAASACPPYVRTEIDALVHLDAADRAVSGATMEGWAKHRMFEAVRPRPGRGEPPRSCRDRLEDVHWADQLTLDLLDYLLAPRQPAGVPIVLTYRNDEHGRPANRRWIEQLARNARVGRLTLTPLTLAETGQQMTMLLPTPPSVAEVAAARTCGSQFRNPAAPTSGPDAPYPQVRRAGVRWAVRALTLCGLCKHGA